MVRLLINDKSTGLRVTKKALPYQREQSLLRVEARYLELTCGKGPCSKRVDSMFPGSNCPGFRCLVVVGKSRHQSGASSHTALETDGA